MTVREGQTLAGEGLLARYANFVRLPHTVFALPFALIGVVLASFTHPVTLRTLGLVVLAFTAGRFVAMGFNRIADRDLDARNPRTRGRELPAGRLTVAQAWAAVFVAAAVFEWAAWALNPLCFALSPVALAIVTLYSYAKRFTWWSHVWLGFGDAIAGPAGYLAVAGRWSEPGWLLWVLAAAVTFWVGGFDVFYALVAVGWGAGLGAPYYAGVAIGAALIAYEHRLVRPDDLSQLNAAFFTVNGIVSVVVFLGGLVDRVI